MMMMIKLFTIINSLSRIWGKYYFDTDYMKKRLMISFRQQSHIPIDDDNDENAPENLSIDLTPVDIPETVEER